MTTYRNEHPKPQFERKNWRNLNGKWQFEIDFGKTAKERKLFKNNIDLKETICVPFCPESKLSGIEYTDFMNSVIYKRSFEISRAELDGITYEIEFICDKKEYDAEVHAYTGKILEASVESVFD